MGCDVTENLLVVTRATACSRKKFHRVSRSTITPSKQRHMTDDYAQRASQHGFASKQVVEAALKEPNAVVLDVRKEDEIAKAHYETDLRWVHTGCTPTACPILEKMPEKLLPDKNGMMELACSRVV